MKGGILFADQVTTVSPTYAREVQTPEHGAGLDGVLRAVHSKFTGILNGIDVDEWDPATDPLLRANYDVDTLTAKGKNKRALLKEVGLPFAAKRPLFAAVSRLVDQKGFQLLTPVLDRLISAGAQVLVLGSGEAEIESLLSAAADRHPDDCRVIIGFDNALAHRIYAGADAILMPSLYEPCGLNQMYALRYGTVPVVRLTGGLADTVIPFDGTNEGTANGFGFIAAHPLELYLSSWLAMLNFKDASVWKRLQGNGMQTDFSWDRSARAYERIYHSALSSSG
jgi:starch synthase